MKKRKDLLWSVPVAVREVSEAGRRFDLTADAQAREAIAAAASLHSLPRFQATFEVSPEGREGLRVTGRISATVGQTCVVTLEPIENTVEEEVELVFVPSAVPREFDDGDSPTVPKSEDAPEPLVGGAVDLGAIATEFLILSIDPYPRAPGATFEALAAGDEGGHPFAALAALKKGQGEQ